MTVEKHQFKVFIKNGVSKMVICGKTGQFRVTSTSIKIVGNAILKTFYFILFFLGRIL